MDYYREVPEVSETCPEQIFENSSIIDYKLEIAVQPTDRHRFRALKEGSHGVLSGEKVHKYPKVTLKVDPPPQTSRKNDVEYSIVFHTLATNKVDTGLCLSPCVLKNKKDDPRQGVMTADSAGEYVYELKDHWIVGVNVKDRKETLKERRREFEENYSKYEKLAPLEENERVLFEDSKEIIYLAFTAFEYDRQTNTHKKVGETKISEGILNAKNLTIDENCNRIVPKIGEATIYLLVSDVLYDYSMEVRETDKRHNTIWSSHSAELMRRTELAKSHKVLVYRVPAYDGPTQGKFVKCFLQLRYGRSESNAVSITYESREVQGYFTNPSKRPKLHDNEGDMEYDAEAVADNEPTIDIEKTLAATQICSIVQFKLYNLDIENFDGLWEVVERVNAKYMENRRTVNTIFHDAIIYDCFDVVERWIIDDRTHEMIRKIQQQLGELKNLNGETLLHLAFRHKLAPIVSTILHWSAAALLAQDCHGNTPLHVALREQDDAECKAIVEQLIEHENFFNLYELFQLYNISGYTVLQYAIIKNRHFVVRLLLQQCQVIEINALEIEVSSTNETILDLVKWLKSNSVREKMWNVIREYIPIPTKEQSSFNNSSCSEDNDSSENESISLGIQRLKL